MVSPSSCAEILTSLSMWAVSESIIEWWIVSVRICPLTSTSLLNHVNWSLCNPSASSTIMILHFDPSLASYRSAILVSLPAAGFFFVHCCCYLLLCIDEIMLLLPLQLAHFRLLSWRGCINKGFNSITRGGGAVANFKVSQRVLLPARSSYESSLHPNRVQSLQISFNWLDETINLAMVL